MSPIKKTTIPLICETSRQTQHAKSRTTQPSVCKTRGARSLTQSANSMETPTTKPENHVQIQYAKRLRTASTTTPASCKNRKACQLYSAVSINTTAVFLARITESHSVESAKTVEATQLYVRLN